MSITLNTVASGYNLQAINDNFSALQTALNNNIVWRTGTVAGETLMVRDLDMNGNNILNIGTDLSLPGSLITVGEADARYVNVTGDILEGTINAAGNSITGLPPSVNASDAVRKSELDAEAAVRSSTDDYLQQQIIGAQPIPASQRPVVQWHSNHLSTSFTVPAEMNAFSIGPQLIIDPGQTVTLGTNSVWNILGNAFSMDALYNLKANTITTSDNASTVTVANLASVAGAGVVPVSAGGTGSTTAANARASLSAATRGSNSDITSLTGLTGVSPLVGVIDASNAAAGKIGEVIESLGTATSLSTSNTNFNLTSITLTPGDWEITSTVEILNTGGTMTSILGSIGLTSGSAAGFPNIARIGTTLAQSFSHNMTIPTRRVNVSSTSSVFCIAAAVFSAGTPTGTGYLRARRIR